MTHELKTWPEYFTAVANCVKAFELRKDDRNYKKGDVLHLKEWDHIHNCYTGRELKCVVDYILREAEVFGLKPGFVIMSITY